VCYCANAALCRSSACCLAEPQGLCPACFCKATGRDHACVWQGHSKVIQALGWSCDGKKLATASAASDVRVWSVDSHKEGKEQVLEDHKSSVDGLSWNPTNPDVIHPPPTPSRGLSCSCKIYARGIHQM